MEKVVQRSSRKNLRNWKILDFDDSSFLGSIQINHNNVSRNIKQYLILFKFSILTLLVYIV